MGLVSFNPISGLLCFHLPLLPFSLQCHHNYLLEVHWAMMSPPEAGPAVVELRVQWRRLVALPRERWAAGTQSVLALALSLLISSVLFGVFWGWFFFFFFPGLEPFCFDPNIFQYNSS